MTKYNIDDLKEEWSQLNKEKALIEEKTKILMEKLEENNLYIDKNNKIQSKIKVWGMEFEYSYLCRYMGDSPYQWIKDKGEGIVEIDESILKSIIENRDDVDEVACYIEEAFGKYELDCIKENEICGHSIHIINNKTKKEITNNNEISIDENIVVKFEASTKNKPLNYEYFFITIKRINKSDCKIEQQDNVYEN